MPAGGRDPRRSPRPPARAEPRAGADPLRSTVRPGPVAGGDLDAGYWAENLRRPVLFADAVAGLDADHSLFVEIGPHPVLTGAVEQTRAAAGLPGTAVASLVRRQDERRSLLRALGRIFGRGGTVRWDRLFQGGGGYAPLPPYTWDEQRFQRDFTGTAGPSRRSREIGPDECGAVGGIAVRGVTPVPPVVYLDAALDTARRFGDAPDFALEDVRLGDEPVDAADAPSTGLRVTVGAPDEDVEVTAWRGTGGHRTAVPCLTGRPRAVPAGPARDHRALLDAALARCREYLPMDGFRAVVAASGTDYGATPAVDGRVWRRNGEAVVRLDLTGLPRPLAVESALHLVLAALPGRAARATHVPVSFARVRLAAALDTEVWAVARATRARDRVHADVLLLDRDGRAVAEFVGMTLRRLPPGGRRSPAADACVPSRRPSPPGPRAVTAPPKAAERAGRTRPDDAREVFLKQAAAVLGLPVERVDEQRPLRALGLDSLMAVDLSRRLERARGPHSLGAARLLSAESAGRLATAFTGEPRVPAGRGA
ncbi:polyketide synthase dehydratase domain-containing protein [Actinomadura kijaniata]|uniref:polyketide synthase dehydratase domain-containing protein n=1 Tax=Actinomadura kijaniata TaxID=46161 RepID=UPI0035E41707